MLGKLKEIAGGLDKIRSGWEKRNIAKEIAETVLQHSKKVERAAKIYGKHFPDIDIQKLTKMGRRHDVAEYKEKDYIPGELTKEEKHRREKMVIVELQEYFGKECELMDIRMEFEEGKTKEAKTIKQLDKLDAAVQAMEYEKVGYTNVTNFYPYTLSELSDPILINILNVLLKKEYPEINAYDQYFMLLECKGDENIFKEKMTKK